MKGVQNCLLVVFAFLVGPAIVRAADAAADLDSVVDTAGKWLSATSEERETLEPTLTDFHGDVMGVMEELRPKGDAKYARDLGREIKGETFEVPQLLARNPDHPFNYYVPPHYDPETPMGLILWMHGGGTYKPGKNVTRRSVEGKLKELEAGDFVFVAAEACHGVNFPPGAVLDEMAGRWSVPASERYLSDLVNEFMHRYHIDPNRVILWGYSMGGIGAYNHAMRSDRFAAVGIGGGSWTWGTFDTMVNTPVYIWHGSKDSYWNSPEDCRNRMTDVSHARYAHEILSELGYEHQYLETEGGHGDVNRLNGEWFDATAPFFSGKEGFIVGRIRDPYAKRVIAMTPRGIYEEVDPKTSGDPFRQAESRHDRWISIEEFTPGPVPVDHLIKEGKIQKAATREEWLNYSCKRSKGTFQGARLEADYQGGNRFEVKTLHVDSFSIWLHPKMVDLSQPILVTTNGVTSRHSCQPSLLTALKSFERREDWGLIYPATIEIRTR